MHEMMHFAAATCSRFVYRLVYRCCGEPQQVTAATGMHAAYAWLGWLHMHVHVLHSQQCAVLILCLGQISTTIFHDSVRPLSPTPPSQP